MATVEVSFTPLPAHVRTARLVATAVARRSGVDEALLDEVRLAVGEACSRAVEAHRLRCPAEPVRIALTDAAGRFEVEVTDTCSDGGGAGGRGGNGGQPDGTDGGTAATGQPGDAAQPGDSAQPGDAAQPGDSAQPGDAAQPGDSADLDLDRGLGLAVIAGLADDVRISETPGGISITMSWPAHCA